MKQETISKSLKSLALSIGIVGLVFFLIGVPYMIDLIIDMYPEVDFIRIPALSGFGMIAVVCYYALFQFYTITVQIGYQNSFCKENVLALRNIAIACLVIVGFILIGDLYLLIMGWLHPSIIICSLFVAFLSIAISIVCFSLSSLLNNAVMIKRENDLTI